MSALNPRCLDNNSSYLKSYPYLFVRENNQRDYFCTLCDAFLQEDDLQAHLFEVHRASNVDNFFVRVADTTRSLFLLRGSLYICVVCWAKIPHLQDTVDHRRGCKVNPSDDDLENGSVPMSTKAMNGCLGLQRAAGPGGGGGRKRQQPQQLCSLCSVSLPPDLGLQAHLREYHRVNCPLDQASCPLCGMAPMDVADLPSHLNAAHGVVPGAAANSILLWVITTSSSAAATPISAAPERARKADWQRQQHPPPSYDQSKLNHNLQFMSPPPNKVFKPEEMTNGRDCQQQQIPTVLQSLLNKGPPQVQHSQSNLAAVETIVSKFTRCHFVPDGKESIQCLICSKWFAVPPVKHLRGHMVSFKEDKQRIVPLVGGCQVCIICYDVFDSVGNANNHLFHKHSIVVDSPSSPSSPPPPLPPALPSPGLDLLSAAAAAGNGGRHSKNKVELDNAGRVKSGKVRKQCELCGEWSNIKWFFKHMSEVHQALFCRCCREYLPIHEHEEHKHWHSEPPYMGQKIRIEHHQPVIIDRKERASLTPIGSLASWGGSSGGKVVKAVDTGPPPNSRAKRRKAAAAAAAALGTAAGATVGSDLALSPPAKSPTTPPTGLIGHIDYDDKGAAVKDTLMPKETCPVCFVAITYKNLARHIKLRHKIKYKFCHKCRKLVPNTTYEEHKSQCNEIVIDGSRSGMMEPSNEEYLKEESIDPTDFLETASSHVAEDDGAEDDDDELMEEDSNGVMDTRKTEEFRANTSKNKLESLMGKEFKHPRRRCVICGYSVSYSNFKRHLRNAHPAQYQECEREPGDFKKALASLSHEIGEGEEEDDDDDEGEDHGTLLGHVMDDEDSDDDDGMSLVDCTRCGDRIHREFMDRHMKQSHHMEEEKGDLRCPVCPGVFSSAEEVLGHCRGSHGNDGYRWCDACRKCVLKRDFDLHQAVEHHVAESKEEKKKKRFFNCPDCNHLFLAESSYKNHLREAKCGGKQQQEDKALEDKALEDKALEEEELLLVATGSKEAVSDEILKE